MKKIIACSITFLSLLGMSSIYSWQYDIRNATQVPLKVTAIYEACDDVTKIMARGEEWRVGQEKTWSCCPKGIEVIPLDPNYFDNPGGVRRNWGLQCSANVVNIVQR